MKHWFSGRKYLAGASNGNVISVAREEPTIDSDGMNIQLFNATGGTIVQFRRYDRLKDRSDNRLYIISADENFSEKFAKIVSMEMIR